VAAIEASSARCKTLADGTLQLTINIEPRDAIKAFTLFSAPGTALAIAALVPTHQQSPEPEKPKGGSIAKWLGIRCGEPGFQDWLMLTFRNEWRASSCKSVPEQCAAVIRMVCEVKSRAEFDNDTEAELRFHERVRGPYSQHMISIGATA